MTRTRILIFVGAVSSVLLVCAEFQACFWTRDYARSQALRRVKKYCLESGRDPKFLTNGKEQTVGNAIWSFDWIYEGRPRHFIGTWISRDGHVELFAEERGPD